MQPTRRQALTAGAVALSSVAAACTTDPAPRPAPRTPDDLLREAAVAREQALVDAYGAALRTLPQHTALLAPLLGDHAAHLAALGPAPAPTHSPTAAPPASAPVAPPVASLRRLAGLERSAAAQHARDALTASRELAALLASLAACEASHAAVL